MPNEVRGSAVAQKEPDVFAVGESVWVRDGGRVIQVTPCGNVADVVVLVGEKIQYPVLRTIWQKEFGTSFYVEIDVDTNLRRVVKGFRGMDPLQEWFITCSPDGSMFARVSEVESSTEKDRYVGDIRISSVCDPRDYASIGARTCGVSFVTPVWSPLGRHIAVMDAVTGHVWILELKIADE